MAKVVVGVIIECEDGKHYLDQSKIWMEHRRPEDGFIHPSAILDELKKEAGGWSFWPKKVYPAMKKGRRTTVFYEHAFVFKWR